MRRVAIGAGMLMAAGFWLTAHADNLMMLYLSAGVMVGLGAIGSPAAVLDAGADVFNRLHERPLHDWRGEGLVPLSAQTAASAVMVIAVANLS
nr:putative MFS-type transporter YhjX [Candidatus Pantoea persica]